MGADLTTETLHPVTYQDTARDRAVLYVCARAHNSDDARLLLDALGLNGRTMQSRPRHTKKTCIDCGRYEYHRGQGLCGACYTRRQRREAS